MESELDLSLGALFVNIDTPVHGGSPFHRLAELAVRAFELADEHAGFDPSIIPPGAKSRYARIMYPVNNPDIETCPIKAILLQSSPAPHVNQVIIDFETRTAECDGQPNLAIEPERFDDVLEEINSHLEAGWRINNAREKARLAHENLIWTDFIERLQARGLISADSLTNMDVAATGKQCPLCNARSTSCIYCSTIMCKNEACAASLLITFQTCSQHVSAVACFSCLESAERLPPLGQCPGCDLWFCSYELTWCLGRPKLSSDRQASTCLPRVSDDGREHPTKAIGCPTCTDWNDRPHCSNAKCWSRDGGYVSVCKLCAPDGGLWCMCKQCWVCDDCKALNPASSCFGKCPRCQKVYCTYECEYIRFCTECCRPTLCDDCMEEDDNLSARADAREVVVLEAQCCTRYCLGKICGACLETTRCAGCKDTFCSGCTQLQPCGTCDGRFCAPCYRTHMKRCKRCDCESRQVMGARGLCSCGDYDIGGKDDKDDRTMTRVKVTTRDDE
ncbi:hypothetical protein BS17DRAFT_146087 [Gyrodon lividus]|nr:hypothetical protein BS17DRAFT_146087 [Gyrodon lividus]